MNIVEKEAENFVDYFFSGAKNYDVGSLKDHLISKLDSYNRDKDKLFFLTVLRKKMEKEKLEHEKTCNTVGCSISEKNEKGLFVIDQEIDEINKYYIFKPKKEDEFKVSDRVNLHNKLNGIIDKLNELGYGQEIIFNEIDELKEQFNLGKKSWFQLLKGKLFDLTVSKTLEETIVKEIYGTLSEGFENLPSLIEKI